ncbi:thioesterase II family protein [Streptomyces sp. NPDC007971]|uniref:thioesterase II family protein n=1 Tax=Streptomyces sp. NPDC007971 TaxID=3364799 RepID=UPI0036E6D973
MKGMNPWLLRQPDPLATARIFCIPYSGTGAGMYNRWPSSVGSVELVPVQLPGRANRMREQAPTTYEELAEHLVAGLEPYLDRPYGFFGHCGSALAAYQAAVQVEATGSAVPGHLFISSQVAPQDGPTGRFLELDDDGLTNELRIMIEERGGNPSPEVLEVALEVLRADIEVNKRYVVPDPVRLTMPITTIGWSEDREVQHHTMSGWDRCGDTDHHVLPGAHYRFLDGPTELFELFAAGLGAKGA